jgi:hypothetical protein
MRARHRSNRATYRAATNVSVRIGSPTSVISRLAPGVTSVVKSVNHATAKGKSSRRSSVSR